MLFRSKQPSDKHVLNLVWTNQPQLAHAAVKGYLNYAPAKVKGQEVTIIVQTTEHLATFKANLQSDFVVNTAYTFPLNLSYWSTKEGAEWSLCNRLAIENFTFKATQNSEGGLHQMLHKDDYARRIIDMKESLKASA